MFKSLRHSRSLYSVPTRNFFLKNRSFTNILGTFVVVHEKYAVLLHRFNKYSRQLQPGLNFKIPFIETISYSHNLREQVVHISSQHAVTQDNVTLHIDGVLYIQIEDPYKASYGIEDLINAITNLAQTTMRSEIGKITLDKTFEERETLNKAIVEQIEAESHTEWGTRAIRYEIRDIEAPQNIQEAMVKQAVSEREKRANILKSEGERQAAINVAEAEKRQKQLRAEGAAEAAILKAQAAGKALSQISQSLSRGKGREAASFLLAEKYFDAQKKLAKKDNVVIMQGQFMGTSGQVDDAMRLLKEEK